MQDFQPRSMLAVEEIQNMIFTFKGQQVMLDSDLAALYGVETKVLNQAVKRNLARFPAHFRFEVTKDDLPNLRSQFVTSSWGAHGGRRYQPYAFTEQGVAMLAAVLKSETAITVSIQIMDAFVAMRKYLVSHAAVFQRLQLVESKQLEADQHFEKIFKALELGYDPQQQGIFYEGQVFDAFQFTSQLIKKAERSIILIDNYLDDAMLRIMSAKKPKVVLRCFTRTKSPAFIRAAELFNQQYGELEIMHFDGAHDRFLIIDHQKCYHFGASLKDLGKKLFAFSRMDDWCTDVMRALPPTVNRH